MSVYPCVYREHMICVQYFAGWDGLSLCIQGTFVEREIRTGESRFIPVYTGNIPNTIFKIN